MTIDNLVSAIDEELARLRQARALLAGTGTRDGKPAESAPKKKRSKYKLSPEGRKRIADAARKRWAAQKKRSKSA